MALSATMIGAAGSALGFTNFVQIGVGGQKVVGTADSTTGPVIVKIIQLAPPHAALALERARREVGVLAAINHPNVVSLASGLAVLGNPPAAVSWLEEKLDGADLVALPNPPRAWADVAKLADDVFSGLTAFHGIEVVHRDLSPRNIRRLGSGDYKVMDPGIARLILETTITGAMDPGSPGYMSPEHVSPAARPTFASDVFVVGVLMYEALTGSLPIPFLGDFNDYARRLRDEQADSIGGHAAGLLPGQVQFVDTLLQRQLARRFLEADEALSALRAL